MSPPTPAVAYFVGLLVGCFTTLLALWAVSMMGFDDPSDGGPDGREDGDV